MTIDIFTAIYWGLIIFGLGVLFLPLSFKLFEKFWDKGWIFSKIIAIVTVSYLAFFLARIHLLPFFRETVSLILLALIGLNLLLQKKQVKFVASFAEIKNWLKKNRSKIIFEETLFLAALIFWSLVRGFGPDIRGLEKFMDYGFVNSILRSTWFPPKDMWFSGEGINYYYFGHLQGAVLTKISGIDSAITYNLMMATVFAFSLAATFSLVANLIFHTKTEKEGGAKTPLKFLIVGGLVSGFLMALGGNLHTIVYVLKDGAQKYWYPDATRYIGYNPPTDDKTIHEFPAYSFVVADLHGHMNDIPTVLLFMALLLIFGLKLREKKKTLVSVAELIPLGFLLGVMYMTNSWDFPIYGVLFAILTLIILVFDTKTKWSLRHLWLSLRKTFLWGLLLLGLSILFALPFAISFKPMGEGVALVRGHSPFYQLLVLWGFFWLMSLVFGISLSFLLRTKSKINIPQSFILAAIVWATILIIIPEIIYVKDIYIPEHHRSNTMFKLVYQSFMMYCLVAGFSLIQLRKLKVEGFLSKALKSAFMFLAILGFSSQMIYPYFSIKGYYGSLMPSRYRGLDGLQFMALEYPYDYEAVLWLKQNISGQPVILEAVGDSYTDYERISMATGLPTVEGWLVHEWLWRGGFEEPGKRSAEVQQIYEAKDLTQTRLLLSKYGVEYVIVGGMEKEKYPDLQEQKFSSLGQAVFQSGDLTIYAINEI